MAEVVEGAKTMHEIPSKGKVNAALTTGIIGTSLSGLMALGALGIGTGVLGGGRNWQGCGCPAPNNNVPHGELYNERKEQADYVVV